MDIFVLLECVLLKVDIGLVRRLANECGVTASSDNCQQSDLLDLVPVSLIPNSFRLACKFHLDLALAGTEQKAVQGDS
ncbi:hypothetical protein R1flu_009190 [Riccia fluitans]